MSSNACKRWCFTINNPTEQLDELIDGCDNIQWAVWQEERGENGTPHYQGILVLKQRRRMTQLKLLFPTAHLEVMRGTLDQAEKYVRKEETRVSGPWEKGSRPVSSQGKRSDLDWAAELACKGHEGMLEIMDERPSMLMKFPRGIQWLVQLTCQRNVPAWRDIEVHVFWGAPGTGKTKEVFNLHPPEEVFKLNCASGHTVWYDGYLGQPVLLLDDFYGWLKYADLLTLLDGYQYRAPVKGGFVYAEWTKVYITSNRPPRDWYSIDKISNIDALYRRITFTREFLAPAPIFVQ